MRRPLQSLILYSAHVFRIRENSKQVFMQTITSVNSWQDIDIDLNYETHWSWKFNFLWSFKVLKFVDYQKYILTITDLT